MPWEVLLALLSTLRCLSWSAQNAKLLLRVYRPGQVTLCLFLLQPGLAWRYLECSHCEAQGGQVHWLELYGSSFQLCFLCWITSSKLSLGNCWNWAREIGSRSRDINYPLPPKDIGISLGPGKHDWIVALSDWYCFDCWLYCSYWFKKCFSLYQWWLSHHLCPVDSPLGYAHFGNPRQVSIFFKETLDDQIPKRQ